MQKEIEATFINIDPDVIRARLVELGATQVSPERLMKRTVFDFPDLRLQEVGGWIRVRDEAGKITTSYKQQNDETINGTIESQVTVDSFESMCAIYEHIGLRAKAYQETKRESWELNGVEVEIDTWPWVPTFVEVEGPNEQAVKDVADTLGLVWSTALHGDVTAVYKQYYNITPEEFYNLTEILFSPVPEWLEAKRI